MASADAALAAGTEARPQREAERSAALIMRPDRLGAFWAGPLSFSRSLLRVIEKERWCVVREALSLDEEGAGSALYRVHTPHLPLFFYVLSFAVPLEEKTDRVIGVKWDAMGVLCIGEPTEARLREMRREMPKQKTGRADADTLMWLRGNKSTRSFEAAVAALAAGRQPDPAILRSTGYLFRTTAFYGNGKLGTMPFAALRRLGILPEPYHAQIMSAWLLREFIADLVDALAAHRSPEAAALDRDNRRYLGIGNSAGVGIVPFIARHPRIIDAWLDIHETALAHLRERVLDPRGAEARLVLSLIERAIAYFDGLPEDGGRFFLSHAALSAELGRAMGEFRDRMANDGTIAISAFLDWAAATLSPETQELLYAICAETDQALAETLQPRFTVNEEENLRPEARIAELGPALDRLYGWATGLEVEEGARHFFWYRSHDAGEPRIAARDGIDRSRREVQMDLPLQAASLHAMIKERPAMTVAALLLARPDLLSLVRRVQSGLERAEVRDNLLGARVVPMPLIRFILSFYGMERFAPGSDRWVRGTLLQGAPTAADIMEGRAGTWPFPLPPRAHGAGPSRDGPRPVRTDDGGDGTRLAEVTRGHDYTLLPMRRRKRVRVAAPEVAALAESALRSLGVPPGLAQEAGELALLAEILAGSGIGAVAEALALPDPGDAPLTWRETGPGRVVLDVGGRNLAVIAPLIVEALVALARGSTGPAELALAGALSGEGIRPAILATLQKRGVVGNLSNRTFVVQQGHAKDDPRPAIEKAERTGLDIDAALISPVVAAADLVLLEPDAESSRSWGQGH
ncbi:MAG TPA: hypothetical protein VMF62_09085 [Acetobacteraceae bacterium]|nr:hypothetical protein [Acetobacteraceae bacterium]